MGSDVLLPFLEYCRSAGRGLFVLVRTTNPGSALLQRHHDAALVMAAELHRMGSDLVSPGGWSPVGAVVGAQVHAEAAAVRERMPQSWFLVPGIGAQGGNADEALAGARADGLGALAVSSRGLLYPPGGPSESLEAARAFTVRQITALAARVRTAQGAISSRL
jgi:orotidine-5'-phosphate decarboxylase